MGQVAILDMEGRPPIPLVGGQVIREVQLTGSASYATGGDTLTAAQLGLSSIQLMLVAPALGRTFAYDYTNSKLQAFEDNGAAGALRETPNATNLSTAITRALVIGVHV